jgi:glycosyltransferase involved in cell wall biosynthesis
MVPPPLSHLQVRSRFGKWLWRCLLRRCLSLAWELRLFRARHQFAGAVTTGSGAGAVFGVLQALPGFRRVPHVMIDCLWYKESRPGVRGLARLKFSLLARSVSRFAVWSSAEVQRYGRNLGLPQSKLVFVPYHHTLEGYPLRVLDGRYVFAGGDGDRDYDSLVEAVGSLDIPVVIATRLRPWLERRDLPPNVSIQGMTPDEFRQAMAGARVVVVPMRAGLLHLGGQQTYLNAMAMGKPVIVCDDVGARDYVTDGFDGLTVPAGQPEALRAALKRLLRDGVLRSRLGRNAADSVRRRDLSTDGCMRRVIALTGTLVQGGPLAHETAVSPQWDTLEAEGVSRERNRLAERSF